MDAFDDNFLYFDASFYKVGGMLAIQRYGQNASTPEDNLTLSYNGMKLASVTGTIGGQTVGASFTYDACGRTLTDGVSKLNYQYNLLGALTSVADAETLTPTTLSTYRHLADGTKYMTVSAGNNGALLYRGPLTFTIADVTATTPTISFLRAETGSAGAAIIASATGSGAAPYYYVLDQLGSVRAVVDGQGSVVERNDYYTYGKRHTTGRSYADLKNSPLLFSGKEDQMFRNGAIQQATIKAQQGGAPAYLYLFNWKPVGNTLGACHGMELAFMFNNVGLQAEMNGATKEAYALADKMSSAWIAFIKTGNPNTKGLPQWEAFNAESKPTMVFDNKCYLRK